jgi:predicted RNA-binding Zn ribbon-like protein
MFETGKFSLIANNLFLDFVNTQKMRGGEAFETLDTFADFLAWSAAVGLLSEDQALGLFKEWKDSTIIAEVLDEIRRFRNTLRAAAENIADGKEVSEVCLAAINAQLKKQSGFIEIEKGGEGFEKRFRFDLSEPSKILQPIAESAADFLCYANFGFLRKCENASCVLYFYDTTKNHRRRWCSMKACGNQAKAAAFYRRKKHSGKVQNKL